MSAFSPVLLAATICAIAAPNEASYPDRDKRLSLNPFAYATDLASDAIDKMGFEAVNPIKITSKLTGAALGTMGLVWGKQENKKCYYYWGLGFSGPDSWNPERWNGEKWDKEEEGGLMNGIGDALGAGFGALFSLTANEEVRVQGCKMLGMGYSKQQPGFPSKPGTCPQGPDCYGPPGRASMPQPGQHIPGMPDSIVTYTIPGQPGQVVPGTPGAVITIVTPGKPAIYIPATEGSTTTYVTPGQPAQYQPGNPGTQTTIYQPGQPAQYQPGTPGTQTTIYQPGQPAQYQPGTPGTQTTVYQPGQPAQYQPGTPGTQTTVYQPQMCSCPCQQG